MTPPLRVLGLAGSLRARSYNRALLQSAARLAPAGLAVEPFALDAVPLYNGDLDRPESPPAGVRALREAIAGADALLVATPEYNHGVPGVLQNALDWASRPAFRSPLAGLPVAVVGAATGMGGTARGQEALKTVLLATLAHPFPHPGILVGHAAERFDSEGRLTDEGTRDRLAAFLEGFETFARRLAPR